MKTSTKRPSLSLITSVLFFGLGVAALVITMREKNLTVIWQQLGDARPQWIVLTVMASLFGSFVRTLRWKQLLGAEHFRPKTAVVFASLMFGYMVNLGIPRLGEISRCASLRKKTGISFNLLLGTVVSERVVDVLSLLTILLVTTYAIFNHLESFLNKYVFAALEPWLTVKMLILVTGVGVVAVALMYLFRHRINERLNRIGFLARFKSGIASVLHLRRPWMFLFCTLLIWMMYFMTSYLCFFALPGTSHLGVEAGLVLVAFGGIARSLPIQAGGFGAFHAVVVELLVLYAVDESAALAVAILIHGVQFMYNLIAGSLSSIYLFMQSPQSSNHS